MDSVVAGFVAGGTTEFLFYGVDSYKTQRQAGAGGGRSTFAGLFRGVGPVIALGSAPCLALFFYSYDTSSRLLRERGVDDASATLVASIVGAVPASLMGNPSDVLKKQLIVGGHGSAASAFRSVYRAGGALGFFRGWDVNLLKDVPFAGIKMGLYESMKWAYLRAAGRDKATTADSAAVGFLSGAASAVLTNPLDVANTRIKARADTDASDSIGRVLRRTVRREGPAALLAGVGPRVVIIGFGSSCFWSVFHAVKERCR